MTSNSSCSNDWIHACQTVLVDDSARVTPVYGNNVGGANKEQNKYETFSVVPQQMNKKSETAKTIKNILFEKVKFYYFSNNKIRMNLVRNETQSVEITAGGIDRFYLWTGDANNFQTVPTEKSSLLNPLKSFKLKANIDKSNNIQVTIFFMSFDNDKKQGMKRMDLINGWNEIT
ncbi:MAG TPA: hypothetical protein EYO58_11685, partial [Flavobacteriales bacterium]|nr:hypothetical protein [Flavobacteriales bacterium]